VIVHDRRVFGARVSPAKADPPLLVNPDAVLTRTVASQLVGTISGRDPQVIQFVGGVDNQEFALGRAE